MTPAQKLEDIKYLLEREPSAGDLSAVADNLGSVEFKALLLDYVNDRAANADRRSEIQALLNTLKRRCRNRREELEALRDGIVAYKNNGGWTLIGTGLGALLSGMPVAIVPIGAGFYLMVTAELARKQLVREMSSLTDIVEIVDELKVDVNASPQ